LTRLDRDAAINLGVTEVLVLALLEGEPGEDGAEEAGEMEEGVVALIRLELEALQLSALTSEFGVTERE